MIKINVIGERSKNRFKDANGNFVEEISTDTDYNNRFIEPTKKGEKPNPPQKAGYEWVNSSRVTHFDTPDGEIHEGEYAVHVENGEERILTILPGLGRFANLSKADARKLKESVLDIPDADLV